MKNSLVLKDIPLESILEIKVKKSSVISIGFLTLIIVFNVIDVITAYQIRQEKDFTAGQFIKGLVFLALFIYNLKFINKYKELVFIYLFFFYLLAVESLNYLFVHHEKAFFIKGATFITKALLPFLFYYFFIGLLGLYNKQLLTIKTLKKGFYLYIFLFSLNVLVPVMMGISVTTYVSTGYSGFYNAGNELGAFVTIVSPILLYFCFSEPKKIAIIFLLLLLSVSGILTGAKTPLLSLCFCFAFVPILLSKRKWIWFFLLFIVTGLLTVFIISYLRDILNLLPKEIYGRLIWIILERMDLLEILLGARLDYFFSYIKDISNRDCMGLFFGYGFINSAEFMYHKMGIYKAAEMDGIDSISRYGLVGLSFIAGITLFIFKRHFNLGSSYSIILIYMFSVLIVNSLLAGHILGNSFSAMILGIIFCLNKAILNKKKDKFLW